MLVFYEARVFNQALEAWDTAKVTNMERSKWQESAGNESGSGGETAVCLCMWLVRFATSVVSSVPHLLFSLLLGFVGCVTRGASVLQ